MISRSAASKHQRTVFRLFRSFTSMNDSEVKKFNAMKDWWDENGSAKPLHAYNKTRVAFISEFLIKDRKPENRSEMLSSLRALDVGSGGGLLSESLGRLGCNVLGIDPSETSVKVSREHL